MAKIRVGRLGRLLLIVVAVVLALPTATEGVYGEIAAAARATNRAAGAGTGTGSGTGSSGVAPVASDDSEHPESGADRCQPRRGGGSTATVTAPTPPGTTVSTAGPVRTEGGLRVTVPLTGRQAVPLSRSGELPVHHRVFRC
ncbi:hypothetical protein DY245_36750 [Streptomyces inhibens]|uniref:Uncharacterized protein n=1 Tax=Streptomyces inhibens TaxID=2293571 RepID=A0A371PTS1_STRIH|nr:hypothetical protein [Streptomyces inhibens]REK85661.1 hypothetical protein DY245_36750 [Streptomyces inhibens]